MNSPSEKVVLCLNGGSSSLKFALYRMGQAEESLLVRGAAERIGLADGWFWIQNSDGLKLKDLQGDFADHDEAVQATFVSLRDLSLPAPSAVGHRVVHGGPTCVSPQRIDSSLLTLLRQLVPFAPLHLPAEITCVEAVAARFPHLPQIACFDTAFHRSMPELAQRFPLPGELWDEGLRRYGFHGLSYEYVMSCLGDDARGRVVIAHLGNGASLAAVREGQPLDTTMGFTPTGGLMMGTRCGDLDPGILLYLMDEKGYDSAQIADLVNHKAGLLGVSGLSSDMKTLLAAEEGHPRAKQAIDMFCYSLCKQIGALSAVLGGLETLVFTGGIGERAAPVRWRTCRNLRHLGVVLDAEKNDRHAPIISVPESPCTVRVIPANEDLMIARHTWRIVFGE